MGPEFRDRIRKIDISCVICDPLTKRMNTPSLDSMMKRARMDVKPTDASPLAKVNKQKTLVGDVLDTGRGHQ